jgi:PAS domain S-box-containing protein
MDARASVRTLRDPDRLRTLEQSGLLDRRSAATFSRLLQLAVHLLHGSSAWIAAVDNIREVIVCTTPTASHDIVRSPHEVQFSSWLARATVMKAAPLIIPDIRLHERWRDPAPAAPAVVAAAAMPLAVDDHVIGAFVLTVPEPRAWTADEIVLLQDLASFAAIELDRRVAHEQAARARAAAHAAEQRLQSLVEGVQAVEERLRLAAHATQDLFYDFDCRSRRLWCTANIRDVLGYDELDVSTEPSWWLERLHPEDRDRIRTLLHDTYARRAPFFVAEFRFRRADGVYLPLLDRGFLLYDSEGKPLRKVGTLMDVTTLERHVKNCNT